MDFSFEINEKGYLVNRESYNLEFKQNFHFGDDLKGYSKTMVGMANNKGGKIIFGIKDSPRIPVGLDKNKFQEFDSKKMNEIIYEHYSHEFDWEFATIEIKATELKQINLFSEFLEFGQITIKEAGVKPIICKKVFKNILKESAIYYRYRGETKEIAYSELKEILDNEKEKERLLWMQHINKISLIGPQNIHLLDTYKGEIHIGNGKLLLDAQLLDRIKFIKEGKFVEKDGAPALKLLGTISGLVDKNSILPSDTVYPLRTQQIQNELKINSYEFQALLWKLNVNGNPKYHEPTKSGKTTSIHKYSQGFLDKLKKLVERFPDYISKCRDEYKNWQIKQRTINLK
jgi:predicted HTH transcriptional regulator